MRLTILSLPLFLISSTLAFQEEQSVMLSDEVSPKINDKPSLSDLLTIETSASIFYSYARELDLSRTFDDSPVRSTLFVPTNKAVMALARKPHQGPRPFEDKIEITEEQFDEISRNNVKRWVSAHIIPEAPITLNGHQYNTLLHGKTITFKSLTKGDPGAPEWSRVVLEDGIHIIGKKEASNGDLYLIDGTVSTE